jgi:hypothetical protein
LKNRISETRQDAAGKSLIKYGGIAHWSPDVVASDPAFNPSSSEEATE